MEKNIKIVVIDDHEIFRNGVIQLINQENDMEVVGEAGNGEDAITVINQTSPNVVIMDISMPKINGLDAGKLLLENNKGIKLLFFSLYDKADYVISALNMGAYGFVLKDTSNKIFLNAIRLVNKGNYYFIGEVSDIIIKEYHKKNKTNGLSTNYETPKENKVMLSNRELDILKLINKGLPNKDIADHYGISVRTIETHRLNIMRKYMVNNIEEVLTMVKKQNII